MNAKVNRNAEFETSYDIEVGVATITSKKDASVSVEVQSEVIEGRSKYSIVGELRYFAGEIRTFANKLVKEGSEAKAALDAAMVSVWAKMQDGTYVLRLGNGESADSVTPQQRFEAIRDILLPTKYNGEMLAKAVAAITGKFAATADTEGTRTAKDGTVTKFVRTRRPAFDKFCAVPETKDFLSKHFASTTATMDDELFAE